MKKSLIFACAAAALLASCSQDHLDLRDGWRSEESVLDDGTPQEIKLGASISASLSTRGTGTVGGVYNEDGTVGSDHQWNGESFNLYMFEKGTLKLTQNPQAAKQIDGADAEDVRFYVLNNKKYMAPPSTASDQGDYLQNGYASSQFPVDASNANYAYAADGEVSYYPTQGAHDFWAYRLDGTEVEKPASATAFPDQYGVAEEEPEVYINEDDDNVLSVDFKIEGDNDILIAKPEVSDVQQTAIGGELNRLWSAYSARKGVHPVMKFQHMLTRLNFRIIDAELQEAFDNGTQYNNQTVNAGTNSNFIVTDIRVFSKTDGSLVVAYTDEAGKNDDTQIDYSDNNNRISFDDFEDLDVADKDARISYYKAIQLGKGAVEDGYCLPLKNRDKDGVMRKLSESTDDDYQPSGLEDDVPPTEESKKPDHGYRPVAGTQAEKNVGEALIVYTEKELKKYYAVFEVAQYLTTKENYDGYPTATPVESKWVTYTVHGEITLPDNAAFLQGYSYTVNVSLHGLERISIYVDATPWENGGETDIDPDEDDWKDSDKVLYEVTVNKETENGSLDVTGTFEEDGVTKAAEGAKLYITLTPEDGFVPKSVKVGNNTINLADMTVSRNGKYWTYVYTVTSEDVDGIEIKDATFEKIDYTIKGVENGTPITVGEDGSYTVTWGEKLNIGTTVTITTEPAEGKEVDKVTVTYGKDDTDVAVTSGAENVYTFEMPASNDVKISVTFKDED